MRIPAEVIPRQYPSIRAVAVARVVVGVKPLPARLRLGDGLGIRSRDYINIFHCKTLMLVAKQYYSTEHGVQPSCVSWSALRSRQCNFILFGPLRRVRTTGVVRFYSPVKIAHRDLLPACRTPFSEYVHIGFYWQFPIQIQSGGSDQ
jgi:hypothetical protein